MSARITPQGWHPMLMKPDLVAATYEGRKTVTRRLIKPYPEDDTWICARAKVGLHLVDDWDQARAMCPYGAPGEKLWIRETWRRAVPSDASWQQSSGYPDIAYAADVRYAGQHWRGFGPWKSPIHLTFDDSRLALLIENVIPTRLQDVDEFDAQLEGCRSLTDFVRLWDEINGSDPRARFDANPWVWRIAFRVLKGRPAALSLAA